MSALTSLLARDQIVPLRRIEEALQKQVLSGGDIASVLLELDALPENTLAAYSAALYGLLPATREEVMRAPRDVVRLVPREVAEKYRLVPLGLDGQNLLCALATPLSPGDEAQLAFLVGRSVHARVVCDVRISAALLHHYGVEPNARHKRLIERLRERDAGAVPYVAPPPSGKVSAGALSALAEKARKSSWLDDADDEPSASSPGAFAAAAPAVFEGRATSPMGVPRGTLTGHAPSVRPAAEAAELAPEPESARTTLPIGSDRVTDLGLPPSPGRAPGPTPAEPAPPPVAERSSSPDIGRVALPPIPPASEIGRMPLERAAAPARSDSSSAVLSARRHRGPLTAAHAVRQLDEVEGRDDVLDVFVAFARQFFDYSAIFVVHEGTVEGRDAFGPGATADEVRTVKVSLAVPSVLADARERRAPAVVPLDGREVDRELAARLGRPHAGPALLCPLAVKNRVVLVLYADRSGDAFEPSDVPELLAILPRVAAALERIILRKKKQPAGFEKPLESAVKDDIKAAARGAVEAARAEPRDRRSLDRWSAVSPRPTEGAAPSTPAPARAAPPASAAPPARSTSGWGRPAHAEPSAAGPSAAQADVAPRSLADAALEVPPEPVIAPARRSAEPARAALGPRGLLGIPRAAPPPPSAVVPGLGPSAPDGAGGRDTLPEGILSAARPVGPITARSRLEREPARPADEDEPDIEISTGEPDDEPEVSVEPGADDEDALEDGDGSETSAEARAAVPDTHTTASDGVATASAYLVRDASIEVVAPTGRRTISSRPPPPAHARGTADVPTPPSSRRATDSPRPPVKRDPRAEDDGAVPDAEVVHVRGGAAPRAQPAAPAASGRPKSIEPPPAGREVPSVIVDMGETVSSLVVDLQHAGPDDERAIVEALLRLGEAALPVIAQAFPGPLWFDRRRPHRRVPRGRDVSAISRALFAFGLRATPYVATLVGSSAPDRRYYALLLAGEMIHPSMLEAVAGRLYDDDDGVRKLAQQVFPRFRGIAGYDEQLVLIRRAARIRGKIPRRRTDSLAALAAARDVGALDLCVELLEDEDTNVARAAHVTLVALTCEDLGPSMRKWAAWADKNRGRHRIEWLIDALVAGDEALRTAAGDELKAVTQQYFGFHPGTTRREREVAQQKYRAWWQAEGKKQFG